MSALNFERLEISNVFFLIFKLTDLLMIAVTGDEILAVNADSLEGMTHKQAINKFKVCPPRETLLCFHNNYLDKQLGFQIRE